MTLEDLDKVLVDVFKLDFSYPECVDMKNEILRNYGFNILDSRKWTCKQCWRKQHMGCQEQCVYHGMRDEDPIGAATKYLSFPNDVHVLPFVCIYIVPIYERVTGKSGIIDEIKNMFKHHLKRVDSE